MFASCAGPGLGCLGRGLGWARAGRWTGRAFQGRLCSSAPGPDVLPPGPARRPLKEWTLLVSPFGRLRARLRCHLAVRPLDPLTFPDGDRVLVTMSGVEGGTPGLDSLQVQYDEALQEMAIVSDTIDPRASMEVNVPLKFDLNIKSLGSGCVKVQNIECDHCKIETEQGTSFLHSVKSQKLYVQTKGGKVICAGTIYGDTDIHASDKSYSDLNSGLMILLSLFPLGWHFTTCTIPPVPSFWSLIREKSSGFFCSCYFKSRASDLSLLNN